MPKNHDLCLSFEPDAIRSHFEGDDTDEASIVAMESDKRLREVAEDALTSDILYRTFHDVLTLAVRGVLLESPTGEARCACGTSGFTGSPAHEVQRRAHRGSK